MSAEPDPRRGVPSCSALERLDACPASWQIGRAAEMQGLVPGSGDDAESGTRIHRWLESREDADWERLSHDERETAARCQEQTDAVMAEWHPPGDKTLTEFRELRLGRTRMGACLKVTPDNAGVDFMVTGQADLIVVDRRERRALVIDYKTGRGEVASATGNKQLLGLAALVAGHWGLASVRVAIVQPWAGAPSLAEIGEQELMFCDMWLDETVEECLTPQELVPAEGAWCQYCPGRAICPALRAQAVTEPESLIQQGLPAGSEREAMMARAMELPAMELSRLLKGRKMISYYVGAIEAAARMKLERGESVPGFELRERVSRRKIEDASAAAAAVAPLLVNAEGGSSAALLRCATLRPKGLQDELQQASGRKSRTRYNLTGKDAKELLAKALDGLMLTRTTRVLVETGAALEDDDGEEAE